MSPYGGGARNSFGMDYDRNGKRWANVCELDSDQDGFTNGEELGDPNCQWRRGMLYRRSLKRYRAIQRAFRWKP